MLLPDPDTKEMLKCSCWFSFCPLSWELLQLGPAIARVSAASPLEMQDFFFFFFCHISFCSLVSSLCSTSSGLEEPALSVLLRFLFSILLLLRNYLGEVKLTNRGGRGNCLCPPSSCPKIYLQPWKITDKCAQIMMWKIWLNVSVYLHLSVPGLLPY